MDREDWNARYEAKDQLSNAEPNHFLVGEARGLIPGRALDLGCGDGRNAIWLAERGWEVTAVDFSDVAIERGRALAARRGVRIEWVLTDLRSYVPDAPVDLVIIFYVHMPSDDLRPIWQRAQAAVAPGGTLLIVGHDSANLTEGYGGPQDPSVLYSPAEVVSALAGFEIVKAESMPRPVLTEDGEFTGISALVRAYRPVVA